jgi:hypothetical protein
MGCKQRHGDTEQQRLLEISFAKGKTRFQARLVMGGRREFLYLPSSPVIKCVGKFESNVSLFTNLPNLMFSRSPCLSDLGGQSDFTWVASIARFGINVK